MRVVAALVVIAVLAVGCAFFADHPGRVAIVWQGWRVETSVGVLVAAAVAAALVAAVVWRVLSWVVRRPRSLISATPRAAAARRVPGVDRGNGCGRGGRAGQRRGGSPAGPMRCSPIRR